MPRRVRIKRTINQIREDLSWLQRCLNQRKMPNLMISQSQVYSTFRKPQSSRTEKRNHHFLETRVNLYFLTIQVEDFLERLHLQAPCSAVQGLQNLSLETAQRRFSGQKKKARRNLPCLGVNQQVNHYSTAETLFLEIKPISSASQILSQRTRPIMRRKPTRVRTAKTQTLFTKMKKRLHL